MPLSRVRPSGEPEGSPTLALVGKRVGELLQVGGATWVSAGWPVSPSQLHCGEEGMHRTAWLAVQSVILV